MGIPDVSEVRIGSGTVVLAFQGPPTAGHIGASVEGPFMTAGDSIVLDETLIAFFEDLDRSWRGWADNKTWASAGQNLSLTARHDGVGRVVITVAFLSPELVLGRPPDRRRRVVRVSRRCHGGGCFRRGGGPSAIYPGQ